MELLLNLAWLLLALPAYRLWRAADQRKFSSRQCLLALACILVLLFPVISATDDLHAMRAEMEESSPGKRSILQAGTERTSGWVSRQHPSPAALTHPPSFAGGEVEPLEAGRESSSPVATISLPVASRAPPSLLS